MGPGGTSLQVWLTQEGPKEGAGWPPRPPPTEEAATEPRAVGAWGRRCRVCRWVVFWPFPCKGRNLWLESIEEGVRTYFKGKEDSKWDVRFMGTGWDTPPTLPHLEDCPIGALAQATEPLEALLEEGLGPVGVIAGALQHLGDIAVK